MFDEGRTSRRQPPADTHVYNNTLEVKRTNRLLAFLGWVLTITVGIVLGLFLFSLLVLQYVGNLVDQFSQSGYPSP